MFIGFQKGEGAPNSPGALWNNLGPSFGLVIDGGSRLGQYVVAPGGFGSAAFQQAPAFGTTTLASVNDGFDVTLTIDRNGWSFAITGLQTDGGAAVSGGFGSWADVPIDFSNFTGDMRGPS